MRKTLLLLALLIQFTFSFGQKQWPAYVKSSCFQGLSTSAIKYGYSEGGKGYAWNWKIKNNYPKTITFNVSLKIGANKVEMGSFTLEPGREHQHTTMYFSDASPSWYLEVSGVYFGTYASLDADKCWLNCDNGTPNCEKRVAPKNTASNSSANIPANANGQPVVNNQSNVNASADNGAVTPRGVPKEYTGEIGFNFDFKDLFTLLIESTTIEDIKRLFFNSGFKLCDNCFQQSDNLTFAKNNESFTVYLKKRSYGVIISITVPSVCPNIQSKLNRWISTADMQLYKTGTYGTKYIYNQKYQLTLMPPGDMQQWEFRMADNLSLNEFKKNNNTAANNAPGPQVRPAANSADNERPGNKSAAKRIDPSLQVAAPPEEATSKTEISYDDALVEAPKALAVKNYSRAYELYKKVADEGKDPEAMVIIGNFYSGNYNDGFNFKVDYLKAIQWYKKAAQQGHQYAMLSLGHFYHFGYGVAKNYKQAMDWYIKAAETNGDFKAFAMSYTGYIYKDGGYGVTKNLEKAKEWLLKACQAGNEHACNEAKAIK